MYPNVDSPNPSSVKLRLSDDNWTANRTVSRYVLRTWIVNRTTNQTTNRTAMSEDRYSIKNLMERYSRTSRDTIYRWCQQAQIQLSQDERGLSYATLEQVQLLDQVASHVNDGKALKHFIPASFITVESPSDKTSDALSDSSSDLDVRSKSDNASDAEMLWQLVGAIASNLQVRSPLQAYRDLEEARQQQWKLSTAQVRQLIGVRPHGQMFVRGSWIFQRDGKIGAQGAWRVHKDSDQL